MTTTGTLLQDYPKLEKWYESLKEQPPTSNDPVRYFIFQTCHCMTLPTAEMARKWLGHLKVLRESAPDFAAAVTNVESSFATATISFFDIVTEFSEYAVSEGGGVEFAHAMRECADLCEAATFRFLSAWCFLNVRHYEDCIDECEKVAHPFAPVYTIHGQALLESGHVVEAIQILEIAIKIAPNEILAHFQLAKAFHVTGKFGPAWQSIETCQRMAPQSLEIAVMASLCCLTLEGAQDKHFQSTFQHLKRCLGPSSQDLESLKYMLELTFQLNQESCALETFAHFDFQRLMSQVEFVQVLPKILRRLQKIGWSKASANLLTLLTNEKAA